VVAEIFATLESLRAAGIPILLVEQNVHRALEVATRFYALERGRVIEEGNARDSGDRARLMDAIAV
jgi:branched-chain amino acid transport system ATP-binding protein